MRIIDLSAPIAPNSSDAAPFERVEIRYTSHAEGAAQVQAMLHVPPHLLRGGEGWAVEEFTKLGTHSVTHVDAPWHYNSTIQGQRAAAIDELPLEWFFSDGVVLAMTHKADGERVEVGDVEAALAVIGYALKPLDIVLVRTGRDTSYGQPDYVLRGCGSRRGHGGCTSGACGSWGSTPGAGTGRWTARPGSAGPPAAGGVLGGPPVRPAVRADRAAGEPGGAPPFGFKVACFPLKVRGGSAGPTRAVAILSD